MQLEHLSLTNFRNYARLEVSFPAGTVLLHGENAQGKTSLLEAIYYLATARSPWATADRQLLNWRAENDPLPFARISAEVSKDNRSVEGTNGHPAPSRTQLDITLIRELTEGGVRLRKEIRINGVSKRAMDLLGQVNVVMFLPQDLALVEGTPADRRRYLNITLAQTDPAYAEALHLYEKVLEQRNALLRRIHDRQTTVRELDYWDDQLSESGSVLIAGRQRLLRELEGLAQAVHSDLTAHAELLELAYQPSFTPAANTDGQLAFNALGFDLHRQLDPCEIAPQFRAALIADRPREIARGMTLIGPQRDELRFSVNEHDLGLYGSRGQARTAVMAIKLAELGWMCEKVGQWPVLLLDEFIAELDANRRAYLLERIQGAPQSILTTTEPDIFTERFLSNATQWKVHAGQITPD